MANDTAALVVALSAQLTRFERDMKQAGDIADRTVNDIEGKFSKLNPAAASFIGNFASNLATKGLETVIGLVEDLVKRFVDLDKVAQLTGVSMNAIFGAQQAANKFGAPVDDVTTSLKNLAVLLNQVQRGEKNSLSDLMDANPAVFKNVNVQSLNLLQTWKLIADVVQNAKNPIDKIDLSKAAGQSESLVKFLSQGGKVVVALSEAAAKTAPDLQALADQAKAFDDAWKKAIDNLKAYLAGNWFDLMKNNLNDLVDLLDFIVKVIASFDQQSNYIKSLNYDPMGNVIGQDKDAFGPLSESAQKATSEVGKLRDALADFIRKREQIDESAGLDTSKTARNDKRAAQFGGGPANHSGTDSADPNRPLSNVPIKPQAGGTDYFAKTEESITKHTAAVKADTIAVSENNATQAQLRAEFQLLNALRQQGTGVTQAQIDQYEELRKSMSAELALEKAHIDLSPAHRQSFLTAAEGAREAQAGYDAARDSVSKLNSASSTVGSALSSAFADAIVEGKSLNDVVSSLIKTLEKAAINASFASIFNAPSSGGLSPAASFLKGIIPGFAGGTNYAPGGAAWVGENGPELVNLPRGSQVTPSGLARSSGGSVYEAPTINVYGNADNEALDRIQAMLLQHQRAIANTNKALASAQRMQSTGVG